MPCSVTDPTGCPGEIIGGIASAALTSGWDAICQAWAEAATSMLKGFATAFVAFPSIDPDSEGIRTMYGVSLGIAASVAAGLFLLEVARTAWTHDGSGLARGLVGLGQMALAVMVTLSVTSAGILASNQLAKWIVQITFGDTDGLKDKIANLVAFQSTQTTATMMLILAVVGIVLVLVLWFELLLCNAAIAVLISTSPIAAAGQVSGATKSWWPKLVSATVQLLMLKPAIALVFALGLIISGQSTGATAQDVATMISGLLILLLAALAWPGIARLFTFMEVRVGGGSGLAAVLGFAAGRATGGGPAAGMDPAQFGQMAEARTMSAANARAATGGAGAGGGAAGSAAGAGAAGGGAAAAALAFVDLAQRAANSLVGRMEQTAGNAGLEGRNSHPYVAGFPNYNRGAGSGSYGGSSYGGSGESPGGYDATYGGAGGGTYETASAGGYGGGSGYVPVDGSLDLGPVFDPGPEPPGWTTAPGGWVPPEPPTPSPGSGPGPSGTVPGSPGVGGGR